METQKIRRMFWMLVMADHGVVWVARAKILFQTQCIGEREREREISKTKK